MFRDKSKSAQEIEAELERQRAALTRPRAAVPIKSKPKRKGLFTRLRKSSSK